METLNSTIEGQVSEELTEFDESAFSVHISDKERSNCCCFNCCNNSYTKGRSRIVKLFYCSFRPFMRCFVPFELIDFILFFGFLGLNVLTFYLIGGFNNAALKDWGKHIGTLLQWNFLFLLLPITRNGIINYFSGCSWERVIVMHKWIARWAVGLMITHAALLIIYYVQNNIKELVKPDIIAGEVAGVLMLLLGIFSLPIFRRKLFQFFMKLHYLCFILTIIFAALHKHGPQFLAIVTAPLVLYILDELFRLYRLMRYGGKVKKISIVGNQYVKIQLTMPTSFTYNSSQWMNLYIPEVAFFQLHPFTTASSHLVDKNNLLFYIKKESQFTKKLFLQTQNTMTSANTPYKKPPVSVIQVDGPYGYLTIANPGSYPMLVLVAGGVGITPIISLFKSIIFENSQKEEKKKTRIVLIWTCRGNALFREFQNVLLPAFTDRFPPTIGINDKTGDESEDYLVSNEYNTIASEVHRFKHIYDIQLYRSAIERCETDVEIQKPDTENIFSDDEDDNNNDDGGDDHQKLAEKMVEMNKIGEGSAIDKYLRLGRPDLVDIFQNIKSNAVDHHFGRVGVVACGPAQLVKKSLRLSSNHSSPFVRFDVHHERFDI